MAPSQRFCLCSRVGVRSALLCLITLSGSGWIAGQSSDDRAINLMEKAQALHRTGDLQGAAQAYKQVLQIRPQWAPAEFNLGLVYISSKQYADAVQLLEAALQHDSSIVAANLFRGIALFNLSRFDQALPALQKFLQAEPKDHQVHFFLAGAFYALEDYPNAARHYLQQIQIAPKQADLYYHLGECYLALARGVATNILDRPEGKYFVWLIKAEGSAQNKEFAAAEQELQEAIKLNAETPDAYVALGKLYVEQGRYDLAAANFKQALGRDPQECHAIQGLAQVNPEQAKSHESRMKTSGRCIQDPLLSSSRRGISGCKTIRAAQGRLQSAEQLTLASCLAANGDLKGATVALFESQEKASSDPRIAHRAFQIYTRLAQLVFAKIVQIAPQSNLLSRMEAQVAELQGKYSQAEAAYRKAIALDESDVLSLVEYARFRSRLGQFDDAIPLFERALELDPYNIQANALLGEVLARRDQPEAAIRHLRIAVEATAHDADSRIRLAQSLGRIEQLDEAISILEAAPYDKDGRIHYVLSTFYRRKGREEDAKQALQVFERLRKMDQSKDLSETK